MVLEKRNDLRAWQSFGLLGEGQGSPSLCGSRSRYLQRPGGFSVVELSQGARRVPILTGNSKERIAFPQCQATYFHPWTPALGLPSAS